MFELTLFLNVLLKGEVFNLTEEHHKDSRGFIKIWSRRASGFDRRALPSRGVHGHAPPEILKFYSCSDAFSCILKHKLTSKSYHLFK